jgi:glycosyltransferase involved in cell wall biosynthesis
VVVYATRKYGTADGLFRGMRIRTVPCVDRRSLQKLTASFMATCYQFFEPEVDIVHFHAIGPSVFCFLPQMIGRPAVVQSHGHEWMRAKWDWKGRAFFKVTEWLALKAASDITAVSHVLEADYQQRYGRSVTYIPTGVNPVERVTASEINALGLEGDDYILFAARLVREKGAHYLIDAYQQLDTDLKLVIAGDAQHEDAYKMSLREKAVGNPKILFPGFVQGRLLAELFSNARIYVLPSEIEGLPISLLEAMSYSNCCVASDIPENQEALEGHGFLFRNKDVTSLRQCLGRLIEDPHLVRSKKESARSHVLANYTWDTIADRLEILYAGILSRKGR